MTPKYELYMRRFHWCICLLMVLGICSGIFCHISIAMASENTTDTCLNHTGSEPECKDCCDCLKNAEERQACRDACIAKTQTGEGFDNNTDLITVEAPSVLGPDYDYITMIGLDNEADCKTYCDESSNLACGDRKYCRDACNAYFANSENTGDTDPPDANNPTDTTEAGISITQAIGDEAQMKTIAFSALAFLTSDFCSNTFFPPGKVSDFFGFQYLRDITPNGFGHNTEFAGRISDSVLSILTDAQVQALVDLANTQAWQVDAYGYKRFVMIEAFIRLLENDLPEGTTGLDKDALKEFTADLYEIDADISYSRANVLGGIVVGLTDAQKTALSDLLDEFNNLFEQAGEGGTIANEEWPAADPVDLSGLTVSDGRVLVSTYATQLFAWYLGSVEGDTYFCPERHGTYFGSFYMKDIPPLIAREAVTIDTNLTADMGQAFLDALDETQASLITGLVDIQRTDLNNIVLQRQKTAEKLRLFMNGTPVSKDDVIALVRQYGAYEGAMMYHYATNFAAVGNSLSGTQAETLMALRTGYYENFPDYQENPSVYDCSGAWLYASKIDMPVIENTDFLFKTDDTGSVVAPGGTVTSLAENFSFAEGPAADDGGNIFFSDISSNLIYKWSVEGVLSTFLTNSMGTNGLYFDTSGNLLACQGTGGCLASIDDAGNTTIIAGTYNNVPFNEPNDLWISPDGGVYFTDPLYFSSTLQQDGQHVYYITPDRGSVVRVIDDMIRPNGIVGTADGTILYVTDHGAGVTYHYTINNDGSLADKQVFAYIGADGMTIDNENNVYLCENGVLVFNDKGDWIETISAPGQVTNACFGGADNSTLFITTRSGLYSIAMRVTGSVISGTNGQDNNSTDGGNTGSGSGGGCFLTSLQSGVNCGENDDE